MGSEKQWKRNLPLYSGSMRQESQSEQAEDLFLNSAVFGNSFQHEGAWCCIQNMCSGGPQELGKGAWAATLLQGM